jgi:hypothetical protein
VEVDDPGVSVTVDGADLVITGAGAREIRLKPGQYKVEASKDGKVVSRELVTVAKDGRQVVRISKESAPLSDAEAWERSVAALPAEKQVEAVAKRLKELNPGFDGQVTPTLLGPAVVGLRFNTDAVEDLSPLRALKQLESLTCWGTPPNAGKLADLTPLRGMKLRSLELGDNFVSDLTPLKGMPLEELRCFRNPLLEDLTPLQGMPLTQLTLRNTRVADLTPLRGMKLTSLWCDGTLVSDLSQLRGMPLKYLGVSYTRVSDLSPLKGVPLSSIALDFQAERDAAVLRSLTTLQTINDKPAADFWKEVDGK